MENKRERIVAAALTAVLASGVAIVLAFTEMSASALNSARLTDEGDEEVFFADIELPEPPPTSYYPTEQIDGNPASSAAAETGGVDMTDMGQSGAEPDLVAVNTPQPENQQVSKPEEPVAEAAPEESEEDELRKSRLNRVPGAKTFTKTPESESAAGQSTTGKAAEGINVSEDGLGLDGRELIGRTDPEYKSATDLHGWVKVKITVDASGSVTKADVKSTSGFGAEETRIRDAFLQASMLLKYKSAPTKPIQTGVITWKISPKR